MKLRNFALAASVALALTLCSLPSYAQVLPSSGQTVSLSQTIPESLTLSAPTPGTITFNTSGVASGSISITVTWNVDGTTAEHAWIVYPYFSTSTALVSSDNASETVSSANVTLSVDGGTAAACNGTGTYAGFTNSTGSTNVCPAVFYGDSDTNTFTTATSPGTIPTNSNQTSTLLPAITGTTNAGHYTGTLNLIAYVD